MAAKNKNPGLGVSTETRAGCSARIERRFAGDVPDHAGERITHSPVVMPIWFDRPTAASRNSNPAERFRYFFWASRMYETTILI